MVDIMICEKCGKKHNGEFASGRFCSISCANSRLRPKEVRDKISKALYKGYHRKLSNCLNCDASLENKQRTYCSRKCQNVYQYKQYIKRWKAGEEDGISGQFGTSTNIHTYIRLKFDNKCSKCGWNEVHKKTEKVPVQLEHIDGNFRNNKEENLTLLCPNCHSLTDTYCGLNRGNGRGKKIEETKALQSDETCSEADPTTRV